jgi:hypothetical protein
LKLRWKYTFHFAWICDLLFSSTSHNKRNVHNRIPQYEQHSTIEHASKVLYYQQYVFNGRPHLVSSPSSRQYPPSFQYRTIAKPVVTSRTIAILAHVSCIRRTNRPSPRLCRRQILREAARHRRHLQRSSLTSTSTGRPYWPQMHISHGANFSYHFSSSCYPQFPHSTEARTGSLILHQSVYQSWTETISATLLRLPLILKFPQWCMC